MNVETWILAAAMAIAAGLVGCFAVMRRLTLAADALSHVALPGISVALALHIHPIFGALAMLFFGALLVWALEQRGRTAAEAAVGVVFSAALAVGSWMTSGEDLIEALFGGPGALSTAEVALGLAGAAAVIVFVLARRHSLVVSLVSEDVARTAGVDVRRLDLLYLQAFALTIALGLRYLGVLLMGALIIVPAATAKRLARSLNAMLFLAVLVALASTAIGSGIASKLHRETGPVIVMVAAALFFASLLRSERASTG